MNEFMKVAIEEGRIGISENNGGPFGAVIVKDGQIIAKAHNSVLKNNDPTCHAEIEAIRLASQKLQNFNLSGCELYTTGKPCPMCRSAIKWAKIEIVYYGCDYDDAQNAGFNESSGNSGKYTEIQMDERECEVLYDEYKNLGRELY